MHRSHQLRYSDFFAQLQFAQDLLAERLGICLVLIDQDGKEATLPSGQPLICHEHENPQFRCQECHAGLIARLSPVLDHVLERCPYSLYQAVFETSIRTDEGSLYLLAGRTADVLQTEDAVDLLKAIYTLPFATASVMKAAPALTTAQPPAQATLTPQENKVLACIVSGLSNKDIANQLCITQSTVKSHVASVLKKLNLSNRTEAGVYALKNGLSLGDGDV
jgi:DNA-binding CsgD family transcriptional regulator